ncbi:unnamed protein product [Microthlaspi erraticum]|uniref:Uncharacterized protein n=1 Tax=Microthlaspi erraticum TaxID=1685480 RepID=A0A6D2JM96_9BRAS|nr:unnamed protein product [Microthlaspi erraticum]CAA7047236.1 unnamed protein product [Microthlaspi erraticum]
MHQEILQELSILLAATVRERDEASERVRYLLAEVAQLQKLINNILLLDGQQVSHYYYPMEETNRHHISGESQSPFFVASPLEVVVSDPAGISSPAISDAGSHSYSSNQMGFDGQNGKDFETIVLETIGHGGVLPENGKFLQAVNEAGQVLESLIRTGRVPKWRNPPVRVSGQRPVVDNNNIRHSRTGNWISGGSELGSGKLNRSFPCKKARFSLMS